jgi:hypothetical protein
MCPFEGTLAAMQVGGNRCSPLSGMTGADASDLLQHDASLTIVQQDVRDTEPNSGSERFSSSNYTHDFVVGVHAIDEVRFAG